MLLTYLIESAILVMVHDRPIKKHKKQLALSLRYDYSKPKWQLILNYKVTNNYYY